MSVPIPVLSEDTLSCVEKSNDTIQVIGKLAFVCRKSLKEEGFQYNAKEKKWQIKGVVKRMNAKTVTVQSYAPRKAKWTLPYPSFANRRCEVSKFPF